MKFRDCPWCGLVHAQMNAHFSALKASTASTRERYYAFLTCPECGGPIVIEHNHPGTSPPAVLSLTPQGADDGLSVDHLPDDVARYFKDAMRVLRAGVPDAAAVQLRRALEAAAAHYEVEERVLVKSIEKLIDQGHVTKAFGPALHHIRKVGNQGAHHTDEPVDQATVQRAFRFTTALLRDLFEVPAELQQLEAEAPKEKDEEAS